MEGRLKSKMEQRAAVPGDAALLKQVWINRFKCFKITAGNRNPAVIEIGLHARGWTECLFRDDDGAGFDMKYAQNCIGVFNAASRGRIRGQDRLATRAAGHSPARGRVWVEASLDRGATFYFTLKENKTMNERRNVEIFDC